MKSLKVRKLNIIGIIRKDYCPRCRRRTLFVKGLGQKCCKRCATIFND